MKSYLKTFLKILFLIFLVPIVCFASSNVMVGTARPAIPVEQVKVYLTAPEKYEEIAIIEASSKHSFSFSDQGKMDKVIERMKEEAAKLGANGILIQGVGAENGNSIITANGVIVHSKRKTGTGIAIFVPNETQTPQK